MSNRIQSNTHSFLIEDAEKHGVDKAVLLYNIRFWLQHEYDNLNKGAKVHDGYVWTFNSAQAYAKQFPYFSPKKIARLLKELESAGVLITGNYNKSSYDRTKWYTMPAYKVSDSAISQNWEMKSPEMRNQITQNEQPIPDVNTDKKHINTQSEDCESVNKKKTKKVTNKASIPFDDIVNKYREALPQLSQPDPKRKLSDRRKAKIRSCWKLDERFRKIEFWSGYFEYVSKSDFLMGNATGFEANIDFLINPNNLEKIIEGQYHKGTK